MSSFREIGIWTHVLLFFITISRISALSQIKATGALKTTLSTFKATRRVDKWNAKATSWLGSQTLEVASIPIDATHEDCEELARRLFTKTQIISTGVAAVCLPGHAAVAISVTIKSELIMDEMCRTQAETPSLVLQSMLDQVESKTSDVDDGPSFELEYTALYKWETLQTAGNPLKAYPKDTYMVIYGWPTIRENHYFPDTKVKTSETRARVLRPCGQYHTNNEMRWWDCHKILERLQIQSSKDSLLEKPEPTSRHEVPLSQRISGLFQCRKPLITLQGSPKKQLPSGVKTVRFKAAAM